MAGSRLLHELATHRRRVRPGHGELDVVAVILLELNAGEARALDAPLLEDTLPERGHVAEDRVPVQAAARSRRATLLGAGKSPRRLADGEQEKDGGGRHDEESSGHRTRAHEV